MFVLVSGGPAPREAPGGGRGSGGAPRRGPRVGKQPLAEADPDMHALMERERERQVRGIELIASENFVCRAVLDALGNHLTNKYSKGHLGARYYGGNQHIGGGVAPDRTAEECALCVQYSARVAEACEWSWCPRQSARAGDACCWGLVAWRDGVVGFDCYLRSASSP
ncbi:hypothetical protein VPH35_078712 [Triticum aestivum]